MIVISDTSPLNYLILIECVHVLPELYGQVVIPEGVFEELQRIGAPNAVREWISARPDWLEIKRIQLPPDASLDLLGLGERQAICLAQELNAAAIIIDEERGRKEARRRGLSVIGILGILRDSAERELIELPAALDRLRKTNFRVSERIIEMLLRK